MEKKRPHQTDNEWSPEKNLIKETKYLEFCKDVNKRLMKEWDQAKKDPFPKLSQLIESTYATND